MKNDYKDAGDLLSQRVAYAIRNLKKGVEPDLVAYELQVAIDRYEIWVKTIDKESKTDG